MFSFSALADSDVAGTWALSGVGCRNQSLDADSHISKSLSQGLDGLEVATLHLKSNGQAEVNAIINGQASDTNRNLQREQ